VSFLGGGPSKWSNTRTFFEECKRYLDPTLVRYPVARFAGRRHAYLHLVKMGGKALDDVTLGILTLLRSDTNILPSSGLSVVD
jgi:hypothetical protein